MKKEQIDQLIALAWCPMNRFRDVEPEEQKNRARRLFVAGTFLMGRKESYLENAVKRYDDEQRKVIIEIPFEDIAKQMGYEEAANEPN